MIDLPYRFNRGNNSAWAVTNGVFLKVWKDKPPAVDWLSSADYAALASERIVARFLGAYDLSSIRASPARDALLRDGYNLVLSYERLDLEPLSHDRLVDAPNEAAHFIHRLSKFFVAVQNGRLAFHDLDRGWRNILRVAGTSSAGHVAVVDVDSCLPVTLGRDRLRSISTGSTDFWGFWVAAGDRDFARFNVMLFGLLVTSSIVGFSLNCGDCLRKGCLPDGRRLDRFFGPFLRNGGGQQDLARAAAGRVDVGELDQAFAEIFRICRDGQGGSKEIRTIADTAIGALRKSVARARGSLSGTRPVAHSGAVAARGRQWRGSGAAPRVVKAGKGSPVGSVGHGAAMARQGSPTALAAGVSRPRGVRPARAGRSISGQRAGVARGGFPPVRPRPDVSAIRAWVLAAGLFMGLFAILLYVSGPPEGPTDVRIEPAAGPAVESPAGPRRRAGAETSIFDSWLAYQNGRRAYDMGNYVEAVRWFQDAVKQDPTNNKAWIMLARSALNKGDLPLSLAAYDQLIYRHPVDPDAWHERGIVLMRLMRLKEAYESVRRALTIRDDEARFWVTLGHIRSRMNDMLGACRAYVRALTLNPRSGSGIKAYKELDCSLYGIETLP